MTARDDKRCSLTAEEIETLRLELWEDCVGDDEREEISRLCDQAAFAVSHARQIKPSKKCDGEWAECPVSSCRETQTCLQGASAPSTIELNLNTTQEERDEWRKERGHGMRSAVGEYTPDAFWDLLNDVDDLVKNAAPRANENGAVTAPPITTELAGAAPVSVASATPCITEPNGKYKFHFEGRTYYTDQRSMTVVQLLFFVDGNVLGGFFQQGREEEPRRHFTHAQSVDMTQEPWFFIDLPATM